MKLYRVTGRILGKWRSQVDVVRVSGKWRSQVDVAVKTLKPGQMSADAFLEEAKIMHKLRHRKLVQLMGVCTQEEPMYIITELMVHGALLDYLRSEKVNVKFKTLIDMAAQVRARARSTSDRIVSTLC